MLMSRERIDAGLLHRCQRDRGRDLQRGRLVATVVDLELTAGRLDHLPCGVEQPAGRCNVSSSST